jgi:recombination protein RecT
MNDQVTPYKNITGLENINRFEDFITAPAVLERVRAVLPMHLTPERMMRTVALAAYKNPKIRECHPISLLGAVMLCASLGCEPNTPLGHAYLIPFEKNKYDREQKRWVLDRVDVNVIIGYPGLIDLARRTGNLVSIRAAVVYEGDEWSYEYGSNMHLRHRPRGLTEGRKPLDAYAFSKLTDGEAFEVLPYEEALSFRRFSSAYTNALAGKQEAEADPKAAWKAKTFPETPWVKNEPQMVAKTMVRRLSTWLPKSIEFARVLQLDALSDQGKIDFRKLGGMRSEEAKEMLEAGAGPEPEDNGEPAVRPEKTEAEPPKTRKPRVKKSVDDAHGRKNDPAHTAPPPVEKEDDPRPFNPRAYLDEWKELLNECETVEQCDKLNEDAQEKLKVDRTRLSIWNGFYDHRLAALKGG